MYYVADQLPAPGGHRLAAIHAVGRAFGRRFRELFDYAAKRLLGQSVTTANDSRHYHAVRDVGFLFPEAGPGDQSGTRASQEGIARTSVLAQRRRGKGCRQNLPAARVLGLQEPRQSKTRWLIIHRVRLQHGVASCIHSPWSDVGPRRAGCSIRAGSAKLALTKPPLVLHRPASSGLSRTWRPSWWPEFPCGAQRLLIRIESARLHEIAHIYCISRRLVGIARYPGMLVDYRPGAN